MWQAHNRTYFVHEKDGTLLIDGIGYCFPDKSQTKPEPRSYIRVTEVNAIEKNIKKFGFYKWRPAEKNLPSEEDLIAAYLNDPVPAFINRPVVTLHLPQGDAIVLQRLMPAFSRGHWTNSGLSLTGWARDAVSVTSKDGKYAEAWGNPTSYFPEEKTMLDLLLDHGYGAMSDDDIFEAIKDVMTGDSNSLYSIVPFGTLVMGEYHGRPLMCICPNSTYLCVRPLLKSVGILDLEVDDFHLGQMRNICGVIRFVELYLEEKHSLKPGWNTFKKAPLELSPAHPQDLFAAEERGNLPDLPDVVRECLRKGFINANYIFPGRWVFDVTEDDNHPCKYLEMLTTLTMDELSTVQKFVEEQNTETAQIVAFREIELDALEPLSFAYIRGERECSLEHSELLDEALDKDVAGSEWSWNGIDYIKTDFIKRNGLISEFTADEIRVIIAEINRINREAEERVRSAIAKGKLPVTAVEGRRAL